MASKLETNVMRLLERCERITATTSHSNQDWRLEKYICALDDFMCDLRRSPSAPNNETMKEYVKRLTFLKGLMHADQMPSAIDKAMAKQLVVPALPSSNRHDKVSREIHLQKTAKYEDEMRKELLGDDADGLKKRRQTNVESDDMDALVQYHRATQEKIADEMLLLARNMKANSLVASSVVKKDIETIDKSCKLAEQNFDRLKVESENLEVHSKHACHWWIWLMLGVVCITFVTMVVFMKLFPKS